MTVTTELAEAGVYLTGYPHGGEAETMGFLEYLRLFMRPETKTEPVSIHIEISR